MSDQLTLREVRELFKYTGKVKTYIKIESDWLIIDTEVERTSLEIHIHLVTGRVVIRDTDKNVKLYDTDEI